MKYFTIKAIYCGHISLPKSVVDGGLEPNLIINAPFTSFLLRNGEQNILVDTGMKDGYPDKMKVGAVSACGDTQMLLDGLAEEGLTPADIDTVIYTHLHYDHAGNAHLFPHAVTYVQQAEYNNMLNPYGFQHARADYFDDTAEMIDGIKRLILVNGDRKLSNGLELYLTKGHSLGSQSIVVPTAKGRYVLTGDVPTCLFNLFPEMDKLTLMDGTVVDIMPVKDRRIPFTVGGFITDCFGAYDSHYMQMALAEKPEPEYFITSHEPGNIYRKYWG